MQQASHQSEAPEESWWHGENRARCGAGTGCSCFSPVTQIHMQRCSETQIMRKQRLFVGTPQSAVRQQEAAGQALTQRHPVLSTCPPRLVPSSVLRCSQPRFQEGFGTEIRPGGSLFLQRDLQGQHLALQRGAQSCALPCETPSLPQFTVTKGGDIT